MDYITLQAKIKALRELGIKTPALNSEKEVLEEFLASKTASVNNSEKEFLDKSDKESYTEEKQTNEVTTMTNNTNYFNSSVLYQATYNPHTRVMLLAFRGNRLYSYKGLHEDLWQAFIQSESAGKFYNDNIRGQLDCTRLL